MGCNIFQRGRHGDQFIMANIKLGSISPYKVSVFSVGASTSNNLPINYSYRTGRLPPGLRLEPDGEITGKVKNQLFSFDNLDKTTHL